MNLGCIWAQILKMGKNLSKARKIYSQLLKQLSISWKEILSIST
jgi:hypothetical protein